ncbi:MAG TPA: HAD-IA family hydrolase [Actinomycetota bacterium]|nr:HAD-IA family hydrolase [Actinomycetota bacterium]
MAINVTSGLRAINPQLRAVFFDAGETLLAPHPSHHELFALVLAERGHPVSPDAVQEIFAGMGPTFVAVMDQMAVKAWSVSPEASRDFWGRIYSEALDRLGVPDPKHEIFEALYERYTRYESYRLFPECIPTLQAVRNAGLVVGLISNFEEWLEGMLIEMEIAPLFDFMVISGKEGIEKPDPAIFHLALKRSGIAAETALYVGDHPKLDVEAARAVGMGAVLIDRKGHHPAFEGDKIETLDGLLGLLNLGYLEQP